MLGTFQVAKRAHAQRLRKEVERNPFVAAVLGRFPGSEVVAVYEATAEAGGAPEMDSGSAHRS